LFTELILENKTKKCRGYKLLSLFRVKIWWMIPSLGRSASDVPKETQLLLLEAKEESSLEDELSSDSEELATDKTSYILFLPVLDGQFRATLQGTQSNQLQFCTESGCYFSFYYLISFPLLSSSAQLFDSNMSMTLDFECCRRCPCSNFPITGSSICKFRGQSI